MRLRLPLLLLERLLRGHRRKNRRRRAAVTLSASSEFNLEWQTYRRSAESALPES